MYLSGDKKVRGWGCSKCKGEDFLDGDDLRELRNCDGETNGTIAFDWMPSLLRCPWSQIDEQASEVFRWWSDWKSYKLLPWHGTLLEQPAFVVESIQFCEGIRAEVDSKAAEEQSRKGG